MKQVLGVERWIGTGDLSYQPEPNYEYWHPRHRSENVGISSIFERETTQIVG